MYEPEERPRTLTRFLLPIGVAIVVAVAVLGAVFLLGLAGGDDGEDQAAVATPTPEVTPTPQADPVQVALGNFVNAQLGASYSGDCAAASVEQPAATPPPDGDATPLPQAGQSVCSQERGEREGVQAYQLRVPLAQPSWWVFVGDVNGNPQVVHDQEISGELGGLPGTPWPLAVGAEVVVVGGDCLNVREGPALDQAAVDCVADGSTIVLASGPASADGFQWWQIEGRAGWVAAEFLRYEDALN